MVPEAAERGRVPSERAAGLSGVTELLASTLGPAAGGSLVALLGPMTGLAVNAGCLAPGSLIIKVALPRGTGRAVEESPSADCSPERPWPPPDSRRCCSSAGPRTSSPRT